MSFFDRSASRIARLMGHPLAFALAILSIVIWGALGPVAAYSDTWQLVINTSTTIVTFLMVFFIQNTQNRENHALHLKIDELLRALDAADTRWWIWRSGANRSWTVCNSITRPSPLGPNATFRQPTRLRHRPRIGANLLACVGTIIRARAFKSHTPRRRTPCLELSC